VWDIRGILLCELSIRGWCGRVGDRSSETAGVCSPDRSSDLSCHHGEEFGAIDASSFSFGSLQATIPETPEEFNVSFMHGDHTLMVRETSIRNHLGRIRAILLLKTIHRKGQFLYFSLLAGN